MNGDHSSVCRGTPAELNGGWGLQRGLVLKTAIPIPPEVALLVLQHLSPPELCRVARTCHRLRALAEDLLYRNIDIRHHPHRAVLLIDTLHKRPQLACKLERLYAFDNPSLDRFIQQERQHASMEICVKLAQMLHTSAWGDALRMAERLRILHITLDSRYPTPPSESDLDKCISDLASPSSCLESLVLHLKSATRTENSSDTTPHALHNLLHRHSNITSLELHGIQDIPSLQPTALPYLTNLVASRSIVVKLVPGRPVERVSILPIVDFILDFDQTLPRADEVYGALRESTAAITDLKINLGLCGEVNLVAGVIMEFLATILPNLKHLAFSGKTLVMDSTTRELFLALTRFPTLETLVFDFHHSPGFESTYQTPAFEEFFRSCTSLNRVEINRVIGHRVPPTGDGQCPVEDPPVFKFSKDLPISIIDRRYGNGTTVDKNMMDQDQDFVYPFHSRSHIRSDHLEMILWFAGLNWVRSLFH